MRGEDPPLQQQRSARRVWEPQSAVGFAQLSPGERRSRLRRAVSARLRASRLTDRITLGGPFRVSGPEAFGPEPAPAAGTLGLFLKRTGGTPVRIGVFSRWTDTEIFGSWPAAISGAGTAELRVVVRYAGNSTFIYGTPLTVV